MIKSCLPANCAVNKAVALSSPWQRGSVLMRAESLPGQCRLGAQVCYQLCWHVLGALRSHRAARRERAAVSSSWLPVRAPQPEDQELVGLVVFGVFSSLSLSFLLVFIDPLAGGCRGRNRLTHTLREAVGRGRRKGAKVWLAALLLFTLFPLFLTSAI